MEDTPNGFPRLAAFQSSETNFSLYRSFNYLHSRILLDLQDEITSLEKELDQVDREDDRLNSGRLRSREIDVEAALEEEDEEDEEEQGEFRNRRQILRDIRKLLAEYDEVLIHSRTLESFPKPSDRNYTSVRRYCNNTKPLMDAEMDSIRTKEDIISLHSGREWSGFDGSVETAIARVDRWLSRVFGCKDLPLLVSLYV